MEARENGSSTWTYGRFSLCNAFRTNQRKNFWLGQLTHQLTGAALAIPLNFALVKTGKDHLELKGAFFGTMAWEFLYGIGRKFGLFTAKPHMTKTHYAELLNHVIYGIVTAQALVALSEPTMFPDNQGNTIAQNTQNTQFNTSIKHPIPEVADREELVQH